MDRRPRKLRPPQHTYFCGGRVVNTCDQWTINARWEVDQAQTFLWEHRRQGQGCKDDKRTLKGLPTTIVMAFSHLGTPSGPTAKKATYLQSNGVRLDTYQKRVLKGQINFKKRHLKIGFHFLTKTNWVAATSKHVTFPSQFSSKAKIVCLGTHKKENLLLPLLRLRRWW